VAAAKGEYNIWYDKPTRRDRRERKAAGTNCDVRHDSGRKRGNDDPAAYICPGPPGAVQRPERFPP
jgi:hypothetical protein